MRGRALSADFYDFKSFIKDDSSQREMAKTMKKQPRKAQRSSFLDQGIPQRVSSPSRQKHWVIIGVIVGVLVVSVILLSVLHLLPWQTSSKDAAIVNGERITLKELDVNYNFLNPELRVQVTKEQFLDQTVIPQTLLLQAAQKAGVTVDDTEIETVLMDVLAGQNVTDDVLEAKLAEVGLSKADFTDLVRKRMIIARFLNATFPTPVVTDEEVATFYELNKDAIAATYGNMTLPELTEGIRTYLVIEKQQFALEEYIVGLRGNATITVVMPVPVKPTGPQTP